MNKCLNWSIRSVCTTKENVERRGGMRNEKNIRGVGGREEGERRNRGRRGRGISIGPSGVYVLLRKFENAKTWDEE